jgi:hypothetical protein
MKKLFTGAVIGLALGSVSAVSALDLSVGGGGFFGSDFGGGADINLSVSSTVPLFGVIKVDIGNAALATPYYGGGAHLFFDATYAELSVGYFTGGGTWAVDAKINSNSLSTIGNLLGINIPAVPEEYHGEINSSFSSVNVGLLGKYPVAVSESVILFPAAGIDYQWCLAGKSESDLGGDEEWGDDAGSYNALYFKFGVGLDIGLISDKLFLRSELLYGVRFANKAEAELVNTLKTTLGLGDLNLDDYVTSQTRMGHGLTFKIGVGFKL